MNKYLLVEYQFTLQFVQSSVQIQRNKLIWHNTFKTYSSLRGKQEYKIINRWYFLLTLFVSREQ